MFKYILKRILYLLLALVVFLVVDAVVRPLLGQNPVLVGYLPMYSIRMQWDELCDKADDLMHGKATLFVNEHVNYTYSVDPLVEYIRYESGFHDVGEVALRVLNEASENATRKILRKAGTRDINSPEARKWLVENGDLADEIFCEALRKQHIIGSEESLLQRAFDPKLHSGDFFHLDCDLLAYAIMHHAFRTDQDMRPMASPLHAYLRHYLPDGFYTLEPTEFRTRPIIKIGGRVIGQRFDGSKTGNFFVDTLYHRGKHGSIRASERLIRSARFFQQMAEEDMMSGIKACVLAGILNAAARADDLQTVKHCIAEYAKVNQEHPIYLSASNQYKACLSVGAKELEAGNLEEAQKMANMAVNLRRGKRTSELIISRDPEDYLLIGKVYLAKNWQKDAIKQFSKVKEWYSNEYTFYALQAANTIHSEALLRLAQLNKDNWNNSRLFNDHLLWVINFEQNVQINPQQFTQAELDSSKSRLNDALDLAIKMVSTDAGLLAELRRIKNKIN